MDKTYISIKDIQKHGDEISKNFAPSYKPVIDAFVYSLEAIPPAEVAPVKYGRWEKRTWIVFDSEKVGYHCSLCNTTWDSPTKFCPHCGSKNKMEVV